MRNSDGRLDEPRESRTKPRRLVDRSRSGTMAGTSAARNAIPDFDGSAVGLMDRTNDALRPLRYWPREIDE